MAAWKDYEREVGEVIVERVGGTASVETDVRLHGHRTGTQRQLDIAVRGTFAGLVDALLVADCKAFSRKVHVKDMEAFIGLVRDVGADLGLLITTEGYSRAAEELARRTSGIHVEVLSLAEL